jgi:hypothetical protein
VVDPDPGAKRAVARELNQNGVRTVTGSFWRGSLVGRILKNENYVGNIVYNRESCKLRGKRVSNPPDLWVRSEGCVEPIVDLDVFLKAKKITEERRVDLTEEEMLARLRRTLIKRGRLSPTIINATVGLPSARTYIYHFGTLRNAYRLIGYTSRRTLDYFDSRQTWADQLAKLAPQVAAKIEKLGERVVAYSTNASM